MLAFVVQPRRPRRDRLRHRDAQVAADEDETRAAVGRGRRVGSARTSSPSGSPPRRTSTSRAARFIQQVAGRFLGCARSRRAGPRARAGAGPSRRAGEESTSAPARSVAIAFEWPDGEPVRWLADREGVPRVATTTTADRTLLTHWVRASASAPWQKIESQLTLDSRWTPFAISRDGRSLIVLSAEGRDTKAVFRYSLEEHALKEMLAGDSTEDIGQVTLASEGEDGMDNDNVGSFVRVVTLGMRTDRALVRPEVGSDSEVGRRGAAGPRQPAQRQLRHRHDPGLLDRRRRSRHVAPARPRLEVAEAVRRR